MAEDSDVGVRVVVTDEAAANELRAALEPFTTAQPLITDRRGIDKAMKSGLVILATATAQSMSAILEAIERLLDRGAVEEFEVSDGHIRVVGPREKDVERFIERWASGEERGPNTSQ